MTLIVGAFEERIYLSRNLLIFRKVKTEIGPKRRSSLSFDETEAFDASLEYEMNDIVFVDPKLKNFLDEKSRQHAVETRMFLSSMIGATSNAMGVSKVNYYTCIPGKYATNSFS